MMLIFMGFTSKETLSSRCEAAPPLPFAKVGAHTFFLIDKISQYRTLAYLLSIHLITAITKRSVSTGLRSLYHLFFQQVSVPVVARFSAPMEGALEELSRPPTVGENFLDLFDGTPFTEPV